MKKSNRFIAVIMTVIMAVIFSNSTFAAVEDTGFSDVDGGAWYAEAVAYCVENGLMSGTGDTEFSPEETMTRAMFASVLYRASGSPAITGENPFTDVDNGAWYTGGVLWAADTGIISGYGDGIYGLNDFVTREQAAVILWCFLGTPAADLHSLDYDDAGDVSLWAAEAALWAVENNILIPRQGNRLEPGSGATRGEVALALMNGFSAGDMLAQSLVEPLEGRENADTIAAPATADIENDTNILIVYFSRTNTTAGVANAIHDITGGDLMEIETAAPYPDSYDDVLEQARRELSQNHRPPLSALTADIDNYDIVFVGYPIWHGTAPMAIFTFLESYDLADKTIVPFATSGSTGISRSVNEISGACPDSAVLEGLGLSGAFASNPRGAVETWLNSLPLSLNLD